MSEALTIEETIRGLLEAIAAKVEALQTSVRPPEFYSIKGAAGVVGVSTDHVRRAVVAGALVASNVGTMARPTYRISRADLLAWVEKGKAGAVPTASRKKGVTPRSRHH